MEKVVAISKAMSTPDELQMAFLVQVFGNNVGNLPLHVDIYI